MTRCPSCGEQLANDAAVFCDQCGVRLSPGGLLMLGSSLGTSAPSPAAAGEGEGEGDLRELSKNAEPSLIEPQRFVAFASRRALHARR